MSFDCTQCRRISKDDFESIPTKEKSFIFKYGYRSQMGLVYFHVKKLFILSLFLSPIQKVSFEWSHLIKHSIFCVLRPSPFSGPLFLQSSL